MKNRVRGCKANDSKKLHYFTSYYAGDNLDSKEWEERSISQLSNFEKKTKVPILALELAYKIENNNYMKNINLNIIFLEVK